MSLVPGDPASLSACAVTARAVAERLGDRATGVRAASAIWVTAGRAAPRRAPGARSWPGGRHRSTAAQLDRVGRVLQDHATDLADLVARARAVEERARAAGLEVRDGRVEIAGASPARPTRSGPRTRGDQRGAPVRARPRARPAPPRRDWVLACCVSRRPWRTSRTGCAADERIAGPTSERTQVRLTTREELNGTVDEVHALLTDPAFQEAKCAATTNNGPYTVDVGGGVDGQRVRTERQLPSDGLPDMARSFVGDHLTIIEVLDWTGRPPTARAPRWSTSTSRAPRSRSRAPSGSSRTGDETLEVIEAELKANVPLIGGKLERAAADPINAAIRIEIELLREWLAR